MVHFRSVIAQLDKHNVSGQRIQVHDKSTATIYFEPGKHGGIIREKYWRREQGCPVAVTLGGDLLLVEVGGTRIPWGMPEYSYAGWLKKEPVEVIKGPTTGLPILAYSEIALEGEMLPPPMWKQDQKGTPDPLKGGAFFQLLKRRM